MVAIGAGLGDSLLEGPQALRMQVLHRRATTASLEGKWCNIAPRDSPAFSAIRVVVVRE